MQRPSGRKAAKPAVLKRLGRHVRRSVQALVLFAGGIGLLVVLGAVVPLPGARQDTEDGVRDRRILVLSTAIHTDIAIPIAPETLATFAFLAESGMPTAHSEARWLLFGWGGRSFYLETPTLADIRPGPAFHALTIDSSVMHVDIVGDIVQDNPAVLPIDMTSEAFSHLLTAISGSFARADGAVKPIEGHAFGSVDRFFEAQGAFNALLGCNTWTAEMLRAAGITTGFWNPLPTSLTFSVRLFNNEAAD